MVAPDKDEDVTVDLATTIILKPGNVNDQSVGYASGIAGEVVNGSMTLPNGITIVAFYLTGRTLVIEARLKLRIKYISECRILERTWTSQNRLL
jgi:hypothetical protein